MDPPDKETARALNDLARHQMITRLYADILADIQVCRIEGWDELEFLRMLRGIIDGFFDNEKREAGACG